MEVPWVRNAVSKLELDVLDLISNFEEQTGTFVATLQLFFKPDDKGARRTDRVEIGAMIELPKAKRE